MAEDRLSQSQEELDFCRSLFSIYCPFHFLCCLLSLEGHYFATLLNSGNKINVLRNSGLSSLLMGFLKAHTTGLAPSPLRSLGQLPSVLL